MRSKSREERKAERGAQAHVAHDELNAGFDEGDFGSVEDWVMQMQTSRIPQRNLGPLPPEEEIEGHAEEDDAFLDELLGA